MQGMKEGGIKVDFVHLFMWSDDYSSFGLRIFFSATRETSFLLLCSARIVGVLLEIFGRASVNYERLMLRNSFGSVDRLKK